MGALSTCIAFRKQTSSGEIRSELSVLNNLSSLEGHELFWYMETQASITIRSTFMWDMVSKA